MKIYAGMGQDNHVGVYGDFIDTIRRVLFKLKGKIIIYSSKEIIEEAKSHYPHEAPEFSLKREMEKSDVFNNEYEVIIKSPIVLGWSGIYKENKIKISDYYDNEVEIKVFW